MNGKLKVLGLVLLATLALSAMATSGAAAEEVKHTFHSETTPTNFTGFLEGTHHVFTFNEESVAVTCEELILEGTESNTNRDTLTLKPTYDKCEMEPFGEAEVEEHHCAYVFESDTTTHGPSQELHAPIDIECAAGDKITMSVPSVGITLSVGPQEAKHGVHYTNVEDPKNNKNAITIETTIQGIEWTCAPAFLCGLGGIPGSGSDGTVNGKTILTGFVDNGREPELTDRTTPNLNHGAAVNIEMTTP